ncbi:glycoside hydrolase family 43 protein [Pontibacter silvestris]|uniref:Glycoside hydrolase family 43 protein n=1 Tax=Pontibacter silvestris TaxID=2305183 RepID=A0ABW4X010_9BACT|nr:glycoside hydrolase family 43 protein [Pontibacter silvestris]MCC9135612.1 glycoside hydrolase family 43 protein [Pontibacter silvestris]
MNRCYYLLLTLCFNIGLLQAQQKENTSFKPGEIWPDTDGEHINAHGGGVLYHKGTYYWFGEHKTTGRNGNRAMVGVGCYSSKDLNNWKNEGIALQVEEQDTTSDIIKGCIIERPKVVYNNKTKKFVMWFHLELKDQGYSAARTAVAISDTPVGPYTYLKSYRPNGGQWPLNMQEEWKHKTVKEADLKGWTDEWKKEVAEGLFIRRDFDKGQMARDMTVFVDDDGKAYHVHASEENLTLHISELSDDYLSFTGKWTVVAPAGHNEAPAICKYKGKYYMITSGCTGWDPNAARSFVSESIWGSWKALGNPAVGTGADLTFESQSTFILPVAGKKDAFIFMADRWRPKKPIDGRYIWLPLIFEDEKPVIRWQDEWTLESTFGKNKSQALGKADSK